MVELGSEVKLEVPYVLAQDVTALSEWVVRINDLLNIEFLDLGDESYGGYCSPTHTVNDLHRRISVQCDRLRQIFLALEELKSRLS